MADITAPAPQAVRLADYRPPAFLVDEVELTFELEPLATVVRSLQRLRRNRPGELVLDGMHRYLIKRRA